MVGLFKLGDIEVTGLADKHTNVNRRPTVIPNNTVFRGVSGSVIGDRDFLVVRTNSKILLIRPEVSFILRMSLSR
jgi:hypothetical protein